MLRKRFHWMAAAVLTMFFGVSSLTSCKDEDPLLPDNPESKTEEEYKQELYESLVGASCLDFGDFACGGDTFGMIYLGQDSTFLYVRVKGDISDAEDEATRARVKALVKAETDAEGGSTDDDFDIVGMYMGTWNVFVSKENPWSDGTEAEEEGTMLAGFNANFKVSDDLAGDLLNKNLTYYVVGEDEDEEGESVIFTLTSGAIDYIMMEGVSEKPSTRGWWSSFCNWVVNTLGVDSSDYNMNYDKSAAFWKSAENDLKTLSRNATTDYANWMGQICTDPENTRICDMNIPGTHDTFTYYMDRVQASTLCSYARTQHKDIEGQWNVGVRVFDMRIRSTVGNISAGVYDILDREKMGLFHGPIWCGLSMRQGVEEVCRMVKEHPTETAILFVDIEGDEDGDDYLHAHDVMEEFKDYFVANPRAGMTLKDCAGKVIVMQNWECDGDLHIGSYIRYGDDTFVKDGFIRFYDSNGGLNGEVATCYYQNRYQASSTTLCTDFWNMKRTEMDRCFLEANKTKGSSKYVWSVNQASAYVGGQWIHMSYAKSSNAMNTWTFDYVKNHKSTKLGIVEMDYAGSNDKYDGYYVNGEALPKAIVETNRWQ